MVHTTNSEDVRIPAFPESRLSNETLKKIEIMFSVIQASKNISDVETSVLREFGISVQTQRRWKQQLRRVFSLRAGAPLYPLATHPKMRQALAYVISRKERTGFDGIRGTKGADGKAISDKGTFRSGLGIAVEVADGALIPLERFIVDHYLEQNLNAAAVYRSLEELRHANRVVWMNSKKPCEHSELPTYHSIARYVAQKVRAHHVGGFHHGEGGMRNSFGAIFQMHHNLLADSIISLCKEIHRTLGRKQREAIYQRALETELRLKHIPFNRETQYDIHYKGNKIGKGVVDFLIGADIVVELKAKRKLLPEDIDQAYRYLEAFQRKLCLLINFGQRSLEVKRIPPKSLE